ncbi:Na+/H+ antiporter NhaC family protein [Metabacillus indicus]|uniref:Sodium:proton antiporter n=1 Tax=Metabacillus indicus TaxID=246786 RepID=A0A084GK39_METID|nr:Na+/H+ antiporter NhaC family protein [Metabacillus indicus]KEZ47701.1 sodium:proton antiporter [Metabacillus indicus]KEZ47786.1 sodium:proton antiporter [Metabacillus indicus LMG 22858]
MMKTKANGWALLPLVIFIGLFVGSGIITGDFYKMPILVAILVAAAAALIMNRKESFTSKVESFSKGAGHPDLMIMVFIFILAGAFSEVAKGMGAVESTVNLALSFLPQSLLIAGLFIIGAFISLAMGTSTGTIAALAPIGVGISTEADISVALAMGAIIGGAMFGDNLSFISDTTIAAVRTQQTEMRDKFKANFFIVLPAAIITCIVLVVITLGGQAPVTPEAYSWVKMLPYIGVLAAALLGVNVIAVLAGGIILGGVIGMADGSYTLTAFLQKITDGIMGMAELVILSLLIGGMVELIKRNGGIHFILETMTKRISSKRGAEFAIAGLVSSTNLATANNTISIIATGPLAKDMADKYEIDKRKSASLLDIFSCSIQGLIPYGAQMLSAAEFASISPTSILPYSFYPVLIALCGIVAILIQFPRFKRKAA